MHGDKERPTLNHLIFFISPSIKIPALILRKGVLGSVFGFFPVRSALSFSINPFAGCLVPWLIKTPPGFCPVLKLLAQPDPEGPTTPLYKQTVFFYLHTTSGLLTNTVSEINKVLTAGGSLQTARRAILPSGRV